jgi:predicted small secreted protein
MTSIGKSVIAALAMGAVVVGLSGCEKREGPAERAGKEVDKVVDKAGQQVERAGEKIQDAASGNKK